MTLQPKLNKVMVYVILLVMVTFLDGGHPVVECALRGGILATPFDSLELGLI